MRNIVRAVIIFVILHNLSYAQIQNTFFACKLGETYSLIAEDILAYQVHPIFMNVSSTGDSVIDMTITINQKINIEDYNWDKCILGFEKTSDSFFNIEFVNYGTWHDFYKTLYAKLSAQYKDYILSHECNDLIAQDNKYKMHLFVKDEELHLIYSCK